MSIRWKLFLWTTGILFLLIAIISVTFSHTILNRFQTIEVDRMGLNIDRVTEALGVEQNNMDVKLADWSVWDDTYTFVADHNEAYIKSNLTESAVTTLKLDYMLFFDKNGKMVYGVGLDLDTGASRTIPDIFAKNVAPGGLLYVSDIDAKRSGIIMTSEGPILVVARPVLHSDDTGPVGGTMIFGRLLDKNEIANLSKVTRLTVSINPVASASSRINPSLVDSIQKGGGRFIQILNNNEMAGYSLINDLSESPVLLVTIKGVRDIYQQGLASIRSIIAVGVITCVVFLILLLILEDLLILRRLSDLNHEVEVIGIGGDLTKRLTQTSGNDELSRFIRTINTTLQSLEYSQTLLKGERERSQAYLSVVGVMVVVLSPSGNVTLINKKALEMLGATEADVVGKDWFSSFVSESEREQIKKTYMDALHGGTNLQEHLEYHVTTMDKRVYLISWQNTVLRNDTGQIISSLSAGEDVTETRQKEEDMVKRNTEMEFTKKAMLNLLEDAKELEDKLKVAKESVERQVIVRTDQLTREQARLMSSIRSLSLGFIMTNNDGKVVLINDPVAKILGASKAPECFDDLISIFGTGTDLTKLREDCRKSKSPVHVDSIPLGGRFVRLFMAPVILQDESATEIGLVFLIEDVTEAKILERSRDEFFSIASHELRTPLTAIRGNTSMIIDYYLDKLPDAEIKDMISDIHESSIRLINIVNDFLNISRLEQKRFEYKMTSFDIVQLSKDAMKEYQTAGSMQQLALTIEEPPAAMSFVFADKDRVREILINLVGNGMKFTTKGGVTIKFVQKDQYVQIMVEDTGRGIALANQSLLFHKFQQAGDSLFTRDTTKGTGLGLYISKLMIEGMGGAIWLVRSEPGVGTTFAFTLPLAQQVST